MGVISPLLATRNVKATIDFYQNILGFTLGMVFPDVDHAEYADLTKDGMSLMFVPAKNLGISRAARLGTGVNLYLEIDGDIDRYYGELKKKGVKITTDIKDEPFGIRDFTIEDNNGYQLTFNQPAKTAKSKGV
jgi:uncharacterized glyoxalase superfamily protein PhnB